MTGNRLASLTKSISARIEGRNIALAIVVVLCIFVVPPFLGSYDQHPLLSTVFMSASFLMVLLVLLAILLLRPQPSEVSEKAVVIKQDLFMAGGMQSHREIIEILREAHSIRDLPPPTALVRGSATNPSDYHKISEEEAAKMVLSDKEGINRLLLDEATRLITRATGVNIAPGSLAAADEKQTRLDIGQSAPVQSLTDGERTEKRNHSQDKGGG